jgi:carbon-monoxide dehydrogenase medium subunit
MKDVSYFAPTDVGEALGLLAEHGDRATILAGGTDLTPQLNYYEFSPDALLYIGGLDLNYVKEENGKIIIGARTTATELMHNSLILEKLPALAQAARVHSSPAIRNAATIAGNLANASPAADLAPPLMIMDAELRLVSSDGERTVPVTDFFTGPGESVLQPHELITEIHVPLQAGNTVFEKLGRRQAQTCSVVITGVRLVLDGQTCQDARIVLGSVAPTPLRCTQAEDFIKGKTLDADVIDQCAAHAIDASSPISDQRASAWYRKKAGKALVARALARAAGIES